MRIRPQSNRRLQLPKYRGLSSTHLSRWKLDAQSHWLHAAARLLELLERAMRRWRVSRQLVGKLFVSSLILARRHSSVAPSFLFLVLEVSLIYLLILLLVRGAAKVD